MCIRDRLKPFLEENKDVIQVVQAGMIGAWGEWHSSFHGLEKSDDTCLLYTSYQAGYDWLGAEQMYGPEEIILSSLRGASRAYSRPLYGTLHAMQWGSGPFTDPKHSLRLYMSLAVAYMHGSSHMGRTVHISNGQRHIQAQRMFRISKRP